MTGDRSHDHERSGDGERSLAAATRLSRAGVALLLVTSLTPCGCRRAPGENQAPPAKAAVPAKPAEPPCQGKPATVTGATLTLSSAKCRYRVGELARFHAELVIGADLPPAHYEFGAPSPMVTLWIGGTTDAGVPLRYCDCDHGLGAPQEPVTLKLPPATHAQDLEWPGREWDGPSDTGNPLGQYFPPGTYVVHAMFAGAKLEATLPIEVIEGDPPPHAGAIEAAAKQRVDEVGLTSFEPDKLADSVRLLVLDGSLAVSNIYVLSGTRVWDTALTGVVNISIPGASVQGLPASQTPLLGVAEGGKWINAPGGALPAPLTGAHSLELFVSDGREQGLTALVETVEGKQVQVSLGVPGARTP